MKQLIILPGLMEEQDWSKPLQESERIIQQYYRDLISFPQKKISDVIHMVLNSEYKRCFLDSMEALQIEQLYRSNVHGQDHVERVCILAAYLAVQAKLDMHMFRLCMECAKYHDIGRQDDSEDRLHGQRGATKIQECCKSLGETDCSKIAAVVEAHSLLDEEAEYVFRQYKRLQYSDYETCLCILYILKDADALDRFRLTEHSLKVDFLRIPESVNLVQAACELYQISIS